MRVLCVDDSPTVLTILKKLLKAPDFEIVGTASNGLDAIQKVKDLKPDVITLDLHMPIMDGFGFVKDSGVAKLTPIVVVSSVSRDHMDLLQPLFHAGVCDFVEKPTLSNMNQICEEISQKLKTAWYVKKSGHQISTTTEVKKNKRQPGRIILNIGLSDIDRACFTLRNQHWSQDELILILNDSKTSSNVLREKVTAALRPGNSFKILQDPNELSPSTQQTVWLHFEFGSMETLSQLKAAQDFVIAEEVLKENSKLSSLSDDFSTVTSFSYLVDKYLGST
jgi:CheY-like chemotaxis protein